MIMDQKDINFRVNVQNLIGVIIREYSFVLEFYDVIDNNVVLQSKEFEIDDQAQGLRIKNAISMIISKFNNRL